MFLIFFLLIIFFISNPINIRISLIIIRFLLYFLLTIKISSWLGVSVVLIFSGGIMIIFLYITSLSRNYKINFKFKNISMIFILIINLPIMGLLKDIKYSFPSNNFNIFFCNENLLIMILTFIFIILTLILCVLIAENFKGRIKNLY